MLTVALPSLTAFKWHLKTHEPNQKRPNLDNAFENKSLSSNINFPDDNE